MMRLRTSPQRRVLARCVAAAALALSPACGGDVAGTAAVSADVAADDVSADVSVDATTQGDTGPIVPRAQVYLHDPVTDQGQTTEVTLVEPTSTDGGLLGPYANVKNCLNEEGGPPMKRGAITVGAFCNEAQTAKRGADGTWLHIVPPTDSSDPNDAFAEVQMYHHVHAMHAFFKDTFGLTDVDFPIESLVNINLYIDPKIAAMVGAPPGWQGFPNAAFVPKEGFAAFNLPAREQGAIIFGQYLKTDLSYDASVIYHEYTHAMIGTTRLSSVLPDVYGIDHMPGAMNEGFADYFAASKTNHPVIGSYGIAFAGPHMVRDLSVPRSCPNDMIGQIHADGRILSSALWKIRAEVGADRADGVILRALQQFTVTTSLAGAVKLILAEAAAEDDSMRATFEKVFKAQGIVGCLRIRPWLAWDVDSSTDKVPFTIMGKSKFGAATAFADGIPGSIQYVVDVPVGTKAITLRWQATAQGFFSQPALAVAVNPATPPTLSMFSGAKVVARAVMPMSPDPGDVAWQTLTLAGPCLTGADGKLYVMVLNQGNNDASITRMDLQVHKSVPSGPNLRTCE
jgi:hypothetical protein